MHKNHPIILEYSLAILFTAKLNYSQNYADIIDRGACLNMTDLVKGLFLKETLHTSVADLWFWKGVSAWQKYDWNNYDWRYLVKAEPEYQ